MKIAYITSKYPAVSHTFILREVQGMRKRGIEVVTFSIRQASAADILGAAAKKEASTTRWLVPARAADLFRSALWALGTQPLRTLRTFLWAIRRPGIAFSYRIRWIFYFIEAVLLARWLFEQGIDHLHCHFGNAGSSTAVLAALLASKPFSMTCHGTEFMDTRALSLPDKVAVASFVVCVSKFGKAHLMLNCPPTQWKKLHVVRCGLPMDQYTLPLTEETSANILCVGRLSEEKAHLVLLEALALLWRQRRAFSCTIVGDGPLRDTLHQRAAELSLDTCVAFTGALPPETVRGLYQKASVVVLPSFGEGLPVVLMEAMALERPVISTYVGGIPELVQNGISGLLVAPGDTEELASAIGWILDHPEQAKELGRRGALAVLDEFELEKNLDRLIELFQRAKPGQSAP